MGQQKIVSGDNIYRARNAAEQAVRRIVEIEHPDGIVQEASRPGGLEWPKPQPLLGVQAAVLLRNLAIAEIREHTDRCRAAGVSWADLAVILIDDHEARDMESSWERANAAFEVVASWVGSREYRAEFRWNCGTCGGHVTDYGPEEPDAERGHNDGCTRRAAEAAAREAHWDAADAEAGN